jgi:hypothetical protein
MEKDEFFPNAWASACRSEISAHESREFIWLPAARAQEPAIPVVCFARGRCNLNAWSLAGT